MPVEPLGPSVGRAQCILTLYPCSIPRVRERSTRRLRWERHHHSLRGGVVEANRDGLTERRDGVFRTDVTLGPTSA